MAIKFLIVGDFIIPMATKLKIIGELIIPTVIKFLIIGVAIIPTEIPSIVRILLEVERKYQILGKSEFMCIQK